MTAEHAHGHHHEPLPTSGRALDGVALSATLHCLTGCAIGEVLGMVIGTALGFSDVATIALAVTLAFFFGYLLTSLPLLRAGLALSAVVPIALAADTASIAADTSPSEMSRIRAWMPMESMSHCSHAGWEESGRSGPLMRISGCRKDAAKPGAPSREPSPAVTGRKRSSGL